MTGEDVNITLDLHANTVKIDFTLQTRSEAEAFYNAIRTSIENGFINVDFRGPQATADSTITLQ